MAYCEKCEIDHVNGMDVCHCACHALNDPYGNATGLVGEGFYRPLSNSKDCCCEYEHASNIYCRSKEFSHGAVKESEHIYRGSTTGAEEEKSHE